jgi:C-terminal peptidase prc
MTHSITVALTALPLCFLGLLPRAETPPAEVAHAQDLEALVAEELAMAQNRSTPELWSRARELRSAERLGGEGELDRALDARLRRIDGLSAKARLLLASARMQGDEADPVILLGALEPLLESVDEELARGAASLFADKTFKGLNRGRRNELVEAFQTRADDTDRSPGYRLDFAMAAYRLGAGSARRKANAVMRSFLDSTDPELRAQGALAIAGATEADITGTLRDVLEELALVPNERGRLAAAYLKLEDERSFAQRKLRDVRNELGKDSLPEEFEELLAVKKKISEQHLEGNKVDQEDLIGAAIDGMLSWMDPHSSYLSSEAYAKFFQELEAEYGGIGAYVREDADNGLFTIVRPIYSGPAYEAGLQTDDKIVRIGEWPTLGQPENDIIKRLKGKPGTPVELYVWRRGMDPELIDRPTEEMKVTVVRQQIEIPAGSYQMLPGGIGLIELTTFNKRSQEQLETWIPQMVEGGMRGLILDMRRNSGGLLTEARDVADIFLPAGEVVVRTESRISEPEFQRTMKKALVPADTPVVILTSRMTASAAEIVAGALQDYGRATLVGKRTFGKGSVQQLLPILTERQDYWDDANRNYRWDEGERITRDWDEDGEVDYCPRVKLTIARYLLPTGRSIHRELDREGNLISQGGVQPDHEVDMPLIERWRYEERERVRKSDALRDYVARHHESNPDLCHRLAINDLKDTSLYPEFDALMLTLETPLSRDDVRDVLRRAIRRVVQDDLGQEFPFGDYVEDPQVQKGIEVVLEALGEDAERITEYGLVFDIQEQRSAADLALLDRQGNDSLTRVREIVESARAGGVVLNDDSLQELLDLISQIEEAEEN